jgi:prefoldin alpha subunit
MADKKPKEEMVSDLDELRYARQVYQNQYMLVNNSAQMMLQEIREFGSSQRTLENIELFNGKESLINTGAGVYIRALSNNTGTVLVEVGGNYVVEKSIDEAKGFLSRQIESKTAVFNKIIKNKKELEAALIDIESKMESSELQV